MPAEGVQIEVCLVHPVPQLSGERCRLKVRRDLRDTVRLERPQRDRGRPLGADEQRGRHQHLGPVGEDRFDVVHQLRAAELGKVRARRVVDHDPIRVDAAVRDAGTVRFTQRVPQRLEEPVLDVARCEQGERRAREAHGEESVTSAAASRGHDRCDRSAPAPGEKGEDRLMLERDRCGSSESSTTGPTGMEAPLLHRISYALNGVAAWCRRNTLALPRPSRLPSGV